MFFARSEAEKNYSNFKISTPSTVDALRQS